MRIVFVALLLLAACKSDKADLSGPDKFSVEYRYVLDPTAVIFRGSKKYCGTEKKYGQVQIKSCMVSLVHLYPGLLEDGLVASDKIDCELDKRPCFVSVANDLVDFRITRAPLNLTKIYRNLGWSDLVEVAWGVSQINFAWPHVTEGVFPISPDHQMLVSFALLKDGLPLPVYWKANPWTAKDHAELKRVWTGSLTLKATLPE